MISANVLLSVQLHSSIHTFNQFSIFPPFSLFFILNREASNLVVEVFLWDIIYCYVDMITWEILLHFKGRKIHLCHGFLEIIFFCDLPIQSHLRANYRWMPLTSAHLIACFSSYGYPYQD